MAANLGYKRIQKKIVELIKDPNFDLQLPRLSDESWHKIYHDNLERDRLEFVGDALMTSFVAQNLYKSLGEGTAHYYTQARSALTANATFAQIMARLGYFDMQGPNKPAGDAFESVIGAYHAESGPEALQHWQEQYFLPLIECAASVCRSLKAQDKRKTKTKGQKVNHILSKLRRARTPNIISPMSDRKARIFGIASPSIRTVSKLSKISRPKLKPMVIDLTAESEPEGDESTDTTEVLEICAQDFETTKASGIPGRSITGSTSRGILPTVASNLAPVVPSTAAPMVTSTSGTADNPITID
ncbi:hypothetical protein V5O48_003284 [Marasmius crinis-equi]|uniref:RNase III domain-containing protein n=1 Tax=Marasmius crinis-equi TaxID=585013 RepID=A0ABR3FTB4_9AGAR